MNEAAVLIKLLLSVTLFIIVLRYFLKREAPSPNWLNQWDWRPGYYDPRIGAAVHIADMETGGPTSKTMVLITGTEGFTGDGHQGVYRLSVTGTSYNVYRITPRGEKRHLNDFLVPKDQRIDNPVRAFWGGMARNLTEV